MPLTNYLAGYPPAMRAQVDRLIEQGSLLEALAARYGPPHDVRTDRALYDYASGLKSRFLRSAAPVAKVLYDHRMHVAQNALGTHTAVSRVQGSRLKTKREIRVAGVFRQAPPAFLRMIVVHELAHLKQREHGRAFYALCTHMEPGYHQIEFDVRAWLTALDLAGPSAAPAAA